ncbi:L-cysteine desulfidase family protein [Nautilia lithotrophica]
MFTLKEILLPQIKPALGCTEPAAIALNASYLRYYVNSDKISPIKLTINTNLLKNAMYVPIPNTGRKFGVKLAFLLGFLCGDKEKGLNIFENVNEKCLKEAEKLFDYIDVNIVEGNEIYIKSETCGYEVITQKYHDYISYIKTPKKEFKFTYNTEKIDLNDIENWLMQQNFDTLYDLIEGERDFVFVKEAVDMNLKLAEIGLNNDCALNIGKTFDGDDTLSKILSITASASDARMEGVNFPAMSLVGSGNHGISAILPVWIYGIEKNFNEKEVLKAVALSMLITLYIKIFIGRLSPICGAAFASGCGVAGAIAYLKSGKRGISKNAVSFVIQNINGVICDGAKMACSLKVFIGAKTGYESAVFALQGKQVYADGILENDITESIRNLKIIAKSMKGVDGSIVEIMKNKVI